MKKYMLIGVIVLLMLLISCGETEVSVEDFVIIESINLADEMSVFSEDDSYIKGLVGGFDLSHMIDSINDQDFTAPKNVFVFQMTKADMLEASTKLSGIGITSDDLREKVLKKTNGYLLVTQLNAAHGVEMQVFSSITNWGKSYIQPENWGETVVVFLEYEGDYALFVSYDVTGDGVISSSASYVKNADGELGEKMNAFFDGDSIKKTEYDIDQVNEILGESK